MLLVGACSKNSDSIDIVGQAAEPVSNLQPAINLDRVFALDTLGATQALSRSRVEGKVVYLDFWASWCAPCIQSMPMLNDIRNQYSDGEFELVSVNVDKDPDKALAFIDKLALNFPVFHDASNAVMAEYKVTGLPTGILINANLDVVLTHRGFSPADEVFLRARIDREIRWQKLHSRDMN